MVDKEDNKKEDSIAVKNDDLDIDFEAKSRSTDKIPNVNILGTNVKLDLLTGVGLVLGAIGALGAGYLWYDNYNKNKTIEDQRKQMEAEQKHQDMVRELAMRRRMTRQQPQPQEHQPTYNQNDIVDMNTIGGNPDPLHPNRYIGPSVPAADYDRLLDANKQQPGGFRYPFHTQPPQQQQPASNEIPIIDMNNYRDEQPMQYPVVGEEVPPPQQQQQRQRDPTPEELYASMNNPDETGEEQYYG